MDLQEQIKAYTAWVNSQLKKRSQHVSDLSQDLRDGSALISVVEIVSGKNLHGKIVQTEDDKKENVSKVLDFMKNNGIKLHHVSAEEIVLGNVKSMMQLILALAAHFKPASIGGRRYNTGTYHSYNEKQRWKNHSVGGDPTSVRSIEENKLQNEMELDIANVKNLAETLQKLLLEDSEGLPIDIANAEEENVMLKARIDQNLSDKLKLEKELEELRAQIRNLNADKAVMESQLERQEDEMLTLRQELLHSNLDKDKLLSEKVELSVELEETHNERERYRAQLRKQEALTNQLEDECHMLKAEQAVIRARKDKEINQLQTQLKNASNWNESVFHDHQATVSRVMPRSPNSPSYMNSSGSPKLARRSPVARNHPPRRNRFSQKLPNSQTRVLYFTDREMTPAMTTISKRVGDITLGDFKAAIRKRGNHRFIFKALDPELGTVKEEVFRDDDIIPGWEGKIVAWVEEELRV